MDSSHLFLFGGSPPFGKHLGKKFSKLALNENGKVAILFLMRRGWREYMERYRNVLEKNGLSDFVYIPLTENQSSNDTDKLNTCSGVIIGGGNTELYHKYIVDTPIGRKVKEMYEEGTPVAGFSAGALISPHHCIISPIDNEKGDHLFLEGLGLIYDCVISAHYSKWREETNLRSALLKTEVSKGYGIDDEEGLYFNNGTSVDSEGVNYYLWPGKDLY